MTKGILISFEGGEGSGKTTQAKAFVKWLDDQGIPCHYTREPGGTPAAEDIRNLLLASTHIWDAYEELFLLMAGRHHHVRNVINPALEAGKIVICDRFIDSTLVYQGILQGTPSHQIIQIHDMATGGLYPELTFVIDLPVPLAHQRLLNRMKENQELLSHYDEMEGAFHENIRQGFLEVAQQYSHRCQIVDGSLSQDQIQGLLQSMFCKIFVN